MAAAQSKSIEEAIDLSWIDMNAADPKHYKAAHRNARLSPIWTREEHIEMDGLFARGCLIKRNRREQRVRPSRCALPVSYTHLTLPTILRV